MTSVPTTAEIRIPKLGLKIGKKLESCFNCNATGAAEVVDCWIWQHQSYMFGIYAYNLKLNRGTRNVCLLSGAMAILGPVRMHLLHCLKFGHGTNVDVPRSKVPC